MYNKSTFISTPLSLSTLSTHSLANPDIFNQFSTMGEKKEKENGGVTVVLKTDFHCDGCASKVLKCIRSFDGVESVTIDGQKITVVGKVDPAKLREKVEKKTHQKVEQISPQPKKDGGGDKENAKEKDNDGHGKKEKKTDKNDSKPDDKSDQKKSKEKEPPVATAVLKLNLHCDGCIHKIYKTVTKTKGYKDMKIDTDKDLVTVTGAMDMKAVADVLQKQLKRDVAIVPPKKDKGDDKEKGGGDSGGDGGDEKVKGNKMQAAPPGYPYPFIYGPGQSVGDQFHYYPFSAQYHAPQIFSDENPNACSVM